MKASLLRALAAVVLCSTSLTAAEPAGKTRLFILSGQSNMKHLIPEESFTPAIKAAFPSDDIIVVKLAHSGQPIRRWYRDWAPKSGEIPKGTPVADIYEKLLQEVNNALQGKPKPDSVTFAWMQGEADTHVEDTYAVYEDSLRGLIGQLRDDLSRPDTTVVIGRISDYAEFPEGSKAVREAEMAATKSDPLAAWIDTDDLNGKSNGLHYTPEGYKLLGQRFAEKAVELISKQNPPGLSSPQVQNR